MSSAIAQRVAAAKGTGGGNHINPGSGELVVLDLKEGNKPEFREGATFLAEMKVLSNEPYQAVDLQGKPKPAGNAVGSIVSFVQQFDKFPDTAFDATQNFVLALCDETKESLAAAAAAEKKTPEGKLAELFDALVDRQKRLGRGMRIRFSTYERSTKAKDKILTLIKWEPVKQTQEEIAAYRAKLDAGTL